MTPAAELQQMANAIKVRHAAHRPPAPALATTPTSPQAREYVYGSSCVRCGGTPTGMGPRCWVGVCNCKS